MKIAVVTPSIAPGDAVSNDVIGMWSALRARGYDAEIFANNWNVHHVGIRSADEVQRATSGANDILIYHFSVGWDEGLDLVRSGSYRKVIKYHNVTPPRYFEAINHDYATACRTG